MGMNSHNNTINENQKPWGTKVSNEKFLVATGQMCDLCLKMFKKGKRRRPYECAKAFYGDIAKCPTK